MKGGISLWEREKCSRNKADVESAEWSVAMRLTVRTEDSENDGALTPQPSPSFLLPLIPTPCEPLSVDDRWPSLSFMSKALVPHPSLAESHVCCLCMCTDTHTHYTVITQFPHSPKTFSLFLSMLVLTKASAFPLHKDQWNKSDTYTSYASLSAGAGLQLLFSVFHWEKIQSLL